MTRTKHSTPRRLGLLLALPLSIPAFYLLLAGTDAQYRLIGSVLYGLMAVIMAIEMSLHYKATRGHPRPPQKIVLDAAIFAGAIGSAALTSLPWSTLEWALRLAFSGVAFARMIMLLTHWMQRPHLVQLLLFAVVVFSAAGAGFYWLDPGVTTLGDGLWLAFTTGATVGYGDLVPSTAAARVFSVFTVLLGYAVLSTVTASISALFIGKEEKRFEREFHADIRALRAEIAALRADLIKEKNP